MSLRAALWVSITVMLVGIAAIVLGTAPRIEAGGLAPFDARSGGYSYDEAMAFLTALTPDGRAVYLGVQRVADTIFPIGLLGTLSLGIFLALRRWSAPLAALATLVPLAYFAFDMLEGRAVAGLLRTEPLAVSPEAVAWASFCTIWKYHFVNAALAILSIGLLARGVAWLKGR